MDQDQPDLQLPAQAVSRGGIHWDFSKAFDNISPGIFIASTGAIRGDAVPWPHVWPSGVGGAAEIHRYKNYLLI